MTDAEILRAGRETLKQALREAYPSLVASEASLDRLLGMAWAESYLGEAKSWAGSHNWGAVTVWKPEFGVFVHPDHDAHGNPVVMRFQAYPNALEGAKGFLRVLLRGRVPGALAAGTSNDLARAMFENRYYTGTHGTPEDRIAAYAQMIDGGVGRVRAALAGATSAPPAGAFGRPSSARAGAGFAVGAVLVLSALALAWAARH